MKIEFAQQALKKYFGYDAFRPMQADIIQHIYDKKDCVVLMPTGGGKSICYQIPAVTLEGVCVVVSPLISLMKDQVESLKANGISAVFLNSSQTYSEQATLENALLDGRIKVVYVSPEKLVSQNFLPFLRKLNVNLFAIDEAHCISAWGHDFRPEYTQLQFLKQLFPEIPIVALTATADKLTRRDIVSQLNLKDPEIFVASFDRPNLSLNIRPGTKRIEQILDFIKERPGQAGIIYCLSRKATMDVAGKLQAKGIKADYYHAELQPKQRSQVQEDFIKDKLQVVCATVAFGMGIDKSNVRWVIHYNLPKNIESYYQEIGRAGRDGVKADTILFHSYADVMTLRDILDNKDGNNKDIQIAKLDRMVEFADAQICRRSVLLNYFGEQYDGPCKNCDICAHPPKYMDGTQIAQIALSAVARLKENVGMTMLIEVLRGSARQEIFQNGYHEIKTYGAGRHYSAIDWRQFIMQLIQQGLLEIAYDDHQKLRLTTASKAVLFEDKKIRLPQPPIFNEKSTKKTAKDFILSPKERLARDLQKLLTDLRFTLAETDRIAPYQVFSDATLQEMVEKIPAYYDELAGITGMSERKMEQYSAAIRETIQDFLFEKSEAGEKVKGGTYIATAYYLRKGYTPEAIGGLRNRNPRTIYTHMAYLYENGEPIDIFKFVSLEEIQRILEPIPVLPKPLQMKSLFDHFNEEINYIQIQFALSYMERQEKLALQKG